MLTLLFQCYLNLYLFGQQQRPSTLDGVIDTMYHTDHHSKDRYLHNNTIVVAKIRLSMVVMLELELPSIHILKV